MKHRLPALAVAIQHEAEASFGDPFLPCNGVCHQEEVSEHPIITLVRVQERREVPAGNNQNMDRGLWADVFEGHGLVVLVDDLAGKLPTGDPTKVAGLHARASAILCLALLSVSFAQFLSHL